MSLGPAFSGVLDAARTGAEWAWTNLYNDLAPAVLGYFRVHGASEPEDLTSEVFLNVVRNLKAFEGDEARFRSWVFVIVHRRLLDDRRKRSRHPVSPVPDERLDRATGDVEAEALEAIETARVRDTFATLSEDQRDVMLLRIVANMSVEQTAEILGKSAGSVKSLHHRGVAALKRALAVTGSAASEITQTT